MPLPGPAQAAMTRLRAAWSTADVVSRHTVNGTADRNSMLGPTRVKDASNPVQYPLVRRERLLPDVHRATI